MRRSTNAILFSAVLLAGCALADEADRGSIEQVVAALNRAPVPGSIFTADASSELDRLPKVKPVVTPVMKPASRGVTISREPWGEASLGIGSPVMEAVNPRIVSSAIRMITPDVAMVDAMWKYEDGTEVRRVPLLVVLRKEGVDWKIVSVRVLGR